VYDAEMAGLSMGAKLALRYTTNHPQITQIIFYVDNSAAAGAIFDPKPSPGQFYAAKFHRKMTKFLDKDITHSIEIAWCPSHCNIKGNGRADELAKEATQLAWNTPIGTSRAFALRRAKATTQSAWIREWQKNSPQRKIRNCQQNTTIPKPHQSLHRTTKPTRSIWPPNPMPHWPCIHGRIQEAVLP